MSSYNNILQTSQFDYLCGVITSCINFDETTVDIRNGTFTYEHYPHSNRSRLLVNINNNA